MENFYARTVFFVKDAERSLDHYTNKLGFSLDWNHQEAGRAYVFQVSLFGFEVIINQTDIRTANRAGHGRVFVGLEDSQAEMLHQHIKEKGIEATIVPWGAPTLLIQDLDENELYFTPPRELRS